MSDYDEIFEFGEEWRDTDNFKVQPVGHFLFAARITYTSKARGTEREKTAPFIFSEMACRMEIYLYIQTVFYSLKLII